MSLPEAIELIPVKTPVSANLGVPGSKSITNRALILAALADGSTTLNGALWSEDTQVMVECLQQLGFEIQIRQDAGDAANRSITVRGLNGHIPEGGSPDRPKELFVGNAGTAARFLTAMLCLGHGTYRLSGVPRMHERPQKGLIHALRALGYRIDSENDRLPACVHGAGPRPGAACDVSIAESSQFASALMLSAGIGAWRIRIEPGQSEHAPYVDMTQAMIDTFPSHGTNAYQIEPDASGGSYFWAIRYLLSHVHGQALETISIPNWPQTTWQIDTEFPKFWPLPETVSRESDLGDSIMTSIVMAPWANHAVTFRDLGRLRVQECERVLALKTELTKCGAKIHETGDQLVVEPGPLHGATIDTYQDHRMAMCFAVIGTIVPGITLRNPACVKKTFPNFFQKLASASPDGLGMQIRDAHHGALLKPEHLIA